MQAHALATEAVQLLILDRAEPGLAAQGASDWIRAAWASSGRRQHVVVSPRVRTSSSSPTAEAARSSEAAILLTAPLAAARRPQLAQQAARHRQADAGVGLDQGQEVEGPEDGGAAVLDSQDIGLLRRRLKLGDGSEQAKAWRRKPCSSASLGPVVATAAPTP